MNREGDGFVTETSLGTSLRLPNAERIRGEGPSVSVQQCAMADAGFTAD